MRILVTGASGLIGRNLILRALREGHEAVALVRRPESFSLLPPENVFSWRHHELPPAEAFRGVQAVIHLAGEGVADRRWSASRKQALRESRVLGTRNLVSALGRPPAEERPAALISGSAIGFYGYQREEDLTENAAAGGDFLAELCVSWEAEALAARELGVRVVLARTGIVLARDGGALAKMPPVVIGNGRNWMSWVHIDDATGLLLWAAANGSVSGPLNLTSPRPATNRELVTALARSRGLPFPGYTPAWTLKLALGELANALLSSSRVLPARALAGGYAFEHTEIFQALRALRESSRS